MSAKKRVLTAVGVIAVGILLYGPGAVRWAELRSRQAELENEINRLRAENRWLIEEARRLREDPGYAEAVARNELGFVRPGETMIKMRRK